MSVERVTSKKALCEHLIAQVNKKLPKEQASLLEKFIEQYYDTVALDDLLDHDFMDLYGAVLSHWKLFYQRAVGENKLKIYNPTLEEHGWQSTHTILEIVHDDMPFLVDSIQMELNRRGLQTHMVVHLGGLKVKRDSNNVVTEIYPPSAKKPECQREALIFIELDRQPDAAELENLAERIDHILHDVCVAVEDWQPMMQKLETNIAHLKQAQLPVPEKERKQSIAFLKWMQDNHFTFIGYREYEVVHDEEGESVLQGKPETGLGVLRQSEQKPGIRRFAKMTPEARNLALSSQLLIIAKTNTKSTIHRPAITDCIIVKIYNDKKEYIGEHHYIGLYTSAAYNRNPRDIPMLCDKVQQVLSKSGLSQTGHAGKALLNILETLPRDDLFQMDTEELFDLAMGVLHLQERRRIKLFVRKDIYGRFISCLLYVPRDIYDTQLRRSIEQVLEAVFHATEISFSTYFSESVLARVHFDVRIDPERTLVYDVQEIESKIKEICRTWEDDLRNYLLENKGEARGNQLIKRYGNSFPASYRESHNARTAAHDIEYIEKLNDDSPLGMSLFRSLDEPEGRVHFKLYSYQKTMPLSDVLPILENMGLRVLGEQPYTIHRSDNILVSINDFSMELEDTKKQFSLDKVKDKFQEAFAQIWFEHVENDGFNRLVLTAGLSAREIMVLRAYTKYFRQIGIAFSQRYIEETLTRYSSIAKYLMDLFHRRFSPESKLKKDCEEMMGKIHAELDNVESLDQDRIMKQFLTLITATLRTNYYQVDSNKKEKIYLSFKLDPSAIPELPLPKPMFEIYVYSTRFEGVHLRSSKVARGGLRWSDRREDFRTEILGLMKAQVVKNGVIVPSGAKGGFVAKCLPSEDRDLILKEGIACYKNFIRGLLDVSDNIIDGEVIHPCNVHCYDDDDPYLVVAADKGTATFSNYANSVAQEYGFWLDDAFASGGETGYDHKKMGITARGAWESVKRHFRELGVNTQTEPFTVVGIGDMAGDVFGNGMLLSPHIKLLAAYNHMHIFIDPDPDPAISFEERQRLFNLSQSSWMDYNAKLISKGGGIFLRSAKAITLTPEIKRCFNLTQNVILPNDLIKALLRSQVDLLWNGGIGTFVKATTETHAEVGDRNNDSIRINASELNCRVIGEGGNLGCTQLSRIEFALGGGLVYSDFIDNSAGVDCSDHEVNIKILLNTIVKNGDMTLKQRNRLLAEMTDEVAEIVLQNNYKQTLALNIADYTAKKYHELYCRYIIDLESAGKLDRNIEFLPDEKGLAERKNTGKALTRPELAILLAYTKIDLKQAILNSSLPEDKYLAKIMESTFPKVLNKKYKAAINKHSLRREIIATLWSNCIVNEMGFTFMKRISDETGAAIEDIVRAYAIASEVFNLQSIWSKVEALDNQVPSHVQIDMLLLINRLIRRATSWIISYHRDLSNVPAIIKLYQPGVKSFYQQLSNLLFGKAKEYYEDVANEFVNCGVPEDIAQQVSSSNAMLSVMDIISVSNEYHYPLNYVTQIYFQIGGALNLPWFRKQVLYHPVENHWEAMAKLSFRDDIDSQHRALTIGVLQYVQNQETIEAGIAQWKKDHESLVNRWERLLDDLRSSSSTEFVMFTVANRSLAALTQASMQTVKHLEKPPSAVVTEIEG